MGGWPWLMQINFRGCPVQAPLGRGFSSLTDPRPRLKLPLSAGVKLPELESKTLAPRPANPTLYSMEVRLNPDLQAKLVQLASQQGRDTEALVVEAVER